MSQGPRKYLKHFLPHLLLPLNRWYLRKARKDRYQGIEVGVPPGVFHPGLYFSTRLMLRHLERYDLRGKTVLEIGAGSGLVAIWCAKKGAKVTATDVSVKAVQAIMDNVRANGVNMEIVRSDLFVDLPVFRYDFVVINPPFFPKVARTEEEMAWYCGENFEYFERLLENLHAYRNPDSKVLMVLSEDCDIQRITQIAARHHWDMEMIHPERKLGEWSFIFLLRFKRVY